MHLGEEARVVRGEAVGLEAEDAEELLGPLDAVVRDVPLPAAELRDRLCLAEAIRGLAHGFVGAALVGHVLADADHADRPVVHVDDHAAAAVKGAHGAVRAHDPLVELERLVVRGRRLDDRIDALAVVGVDALEVALVARLERLRIGAVDGVQLARPGARPGRDVPLPDPELGHLLRGPQLLLTVEEPLAEHPDRIGRRIGPARSRAGAGWCSHRLSVLALAPVRGSSGRSETWYRAAFGWQGWPVQFRPPRL